MKCIVARLSDKVQPVCKEALDVLLKLSEQGKVSKIFGLNIIDVLVAEFRDSVRPTIPRIVALLCDRDWPVCKEDLDVLLKLSEQGKVSNFLT